MTPKLIIIADDARQRHALTDVSQSCGFEVLHCLASRQLSAEQLNHQPDLWIIDVEKEDDLLEVIGFDQPFLVGLTTAPSFTEQVMYKRWKQAVSRKLLKLLSNDVPILTNRVVSGLTHGRVTPSKVLPDAWRVVLLAASMGGLEAVKAFLDQLPTDLPVVFLLVQHIDPYMQVQLPRILSRHNQWPIVILDEPIEQLECSKVYIVPALHQISFTQHGGVQLLSENWPGAYQPSITEMMHRASNLFRQQLLTVVFSGMGDDGSHSAAHQIACGGMIWAQIADSCACPSQPDQMRATGQVSFNATPEGLAEQLMNEYQQSREKSCEG
ncbi:chemotaxis protein CheB [Alkanindiges sp. WGS2144]|uniref:chemotaxis protein CheB n=1 Tax=Alkanindiges sp. WGS2144 TaxID=3366808 RepID=UPI0037519920